MSLIRTWSPFFSGTARNQGRELHSEGAVTLRPHEQEVLLRAVVAEAEGSVEVSFERDGGSASCNCECEDFEVGALCRHVWAVLLEGQRQHVNNELEPDKISDALWALSPKPPRARKRKATAARRATAEPEWIGRLSLLRPAGFSFEQEKEPAPTSFSVVGSTSTDWSTPDVAASRTVNAAASACCPAPGNACSTRSSRPIGPSWKTKRRTPPRCTGTIARAHGRSGPPGGSAMAR